MDKDPEDSMTSPLLLLPQPDLRFDPWPIYLTGSLASPLRCLMFQNLCVKKLASNSASNQLLQATPVIRIWSCPLLGPLKQQQSNSLPSPPAENPGVPWSLRPVPGNWSSPTAAVLHGWQPDNQQLLFPQGWCLRSSNLVPKGRVSGSWRAAGASLSWWEFGKAGSGIREGNCSSRTREETKEQRCRAFLSLALLEDAA